jgi:hypothetical protein
MPSEKKKCKIVCISFDVLNYILKEANEFLHALILGIIIESG